jgi:uncharacterized protein
MILLPITLTAMGLAALVNIWLSVRIGQVRTREKVSIGDGGNEAVIRRMRAQANYIENTPFVLGLIAVIELAKGSGNPSWLLWLMIVYFIARVLHALGMDELKYGRMIGTLVSLLTLAGLGLYALAIPYLADGQISQPTQVELQGAEAVPES